MREGLWYYGDQYLLLEPWKPEVFRPGIVDRHARVYVLETINAYHVGVKPNVCDVRRPAVPEKWIRGSTGSENLPHGHTRDLNATAVVAFETSAMVR